MLHKVKLLKSSAKIVEDVYMTLMHVAVYSHIVNNVELVRVKDPPVGDVWKNTLMAACVNRACLLILVVIIFRRIAITVENTLAKTLERSVPAMLDGNIA